MCLGKKKSWPKFVCPYHSCGTSRWNSLFLILDRLSPNSCSQLRGMSKQMENLTLSFCVPSSIYVSVLFKSLRALKKYLRGPCTSREPELHHWFTAQIPSRLESKLGIDSSIHVSYMSGRSLIIITSILQGLY